jgi:hypothetical protein
MAEAILNSLLGKSVLGQEGQDCMAEAKIA